MSAGSRDPNRVGRILGGKWHVERELGRGGTSTVYLAKSLDGRLHGALKIFHSELSQHPRVLKMLLSEARLVAGIDHPGTVKVYDDGVEGDCAYIVFELLVGQSLEDVREACGGRMPLEEVMILGNTIMDALDAVHRAGVVHRDLKPANIYVLAGGGVKLLDFGFAKLRGFTADAAQNVVGTPSFMSPEAALGLTKKVDVQSDVWSLGATLFFILSGQSVHIATHMDAMMLASAQTKPRSLADAAPELPSPIVAVVDRALAYRKADRFPDIAAMKQAWQDAHPDWLATLPPPKFIADPSFLDPSLLVSLPPSKEPKVQLFDPRRELLDSVQPQLQQQRHPGPLPLPKKKQ